MFQFATKLSCYIFHRSKPVLLCLDAVGLLLFALVYLNIQATGPSQRVSVWNCFLLSSRPASNLRLHLTVLTNCITANKTVLQISKIYCSSMVQFLKQCIDFRRTLLLFTNDLMGCTTLQQTAHSSLSFSNSPEQLAGQWLTHSLRWLGA